MLILVGARADGCIGWCDFLFMFEDGKMRLERIESLKAKGGMSDGGKGSQISDNLRTDEIISEKQ